MMAFISNFRAFKSSGPVLPFRGFKMLLMVASEVCLRIARGVNFLIID